MPPKNTASYELRRGSFDLSEVVRLADHNLIIPIRVNMKIEQIFVFGIVFQCNLWLLLIASYWLSPWSELWILHFFFISSKSHKRANTANECIRSRCFMNQTPRMTRTASITFQSNIATPVIIYSLYLLRAKNHERKIKIFWLKTNKQYQQSGMFDSFESDTHSHAHTLTRT